MKLETMHVQKLMLALPEGEDGTRARLPDKVILLSLRLIGLSALDVDAYIFHSQYGVDYRGLKYVQYDC